MTIQSIHNLSDPADAWHLPGMQTRDSQEWRLKLPVTKTNTQVLHSVRNGESWVSQKIQKAKLLSIPSCGWRAPFQSLSRWCADTRGSRLKVMASISALFLQLKCLNFVNLGSTFSSSQGLLLALHSGITSYKIQRTI